MTVEQLADYYTWRLLTQPGQELSLKFATERQAKRFMAKVKENIVRLGGMTVMAEVQAGRDPCAGCTGPRDKCKGRLEK